MLGGQKAIGRDLVEMSGMVWCTITNVDNMKVMTRSLYLNTELLLAAIGLKPPHCPYICDSVEFTL